MPDSEPRLPAWYGVLDQKLNESTKRLENRLSAQDGKLDTIDAATKLTNARVTAIERERHEEGAVQEERLRVAEARSSHWRWLWPVILTGLLVLVAALQVLGIHA